MVHELQAGDYLVFQLESGYGLLRVLGVDDNATDCVWHVAAFDDLFMDIESADAAIGDPAALVVARSHIALTERAFGSTQVAKVGHSPLTDAEQNGLRGWHSDPERIVHDRSIRLLLGLR